MIYGKEIVAIAVAYALGCISTGYYLTRLLTGTDIRLTGSGSTGARNVSRVLGKRWFVFTVGADFAKGAAAGGLALYLDTPSWVIAACVLTAVAGHIWPAQLGFRGGKGVSVMLGGLVAFNYLLVLVMGTVFGLLYLVTHKYIVSGMVAIVTLPLAAMFLDCGPKSLSILIVLTVLVLFSHRSNICGAIQEGRAKAGAIFGSEK